MKARCPHGAPWWRLDCRWCHDEAVAKAKEWAEREHGPGIYLPVGGYWWLHEEPVFLIKTTPHGPSIPELVRQVFGVEWPYNSC